ncbi:formate dehydrogenase accessory sulfurtransferase FdhD [Ammoniphilus sp. YIM 78166]|uniref:formate dehydrogenase accessory sulfurtransferase FdhD n=1 Tax=Ammoniphilus sp. YIM 78166 TaxID=1644106 RepID=UPI00107055A5|nr:formate dehydrogenase accessory sulfurtransferase FdhD [Ammoniphilus sp. YIM 78166]
MVRKFCPQEFTVTLYLNRYEMVSIQMSNTDWEDWAIGYLYSEGVIHSASDLKRLIIDQDRFKIWADLKPGFDAERFLKQRRHLTAGCGNGVTFQSIADVRGLHKISSSYSVRLSFLNQKMKEFAKLTPMYHETGGMHAACLVDPLGNIMVREDIGRHNAVDKVIGQAVKELRDPSSLILMTTGRISYEMLSKAAKFGIPILASRTAATNQAVELAELLGVEIVGYIRGQMSVLYTSCHRVLDDLIKVAGK